MITEQREISAVGSEKDIVDLIASTSCDMGRLGFDYHDYIFIDPLHIKLIFRKEDPHGLRTEGRELD